MESDIRAEYKIENGHSYIAIPDINFLDNFMEIHKNNENYEGLVYISGDARKHKNIDAERIWITGENVENYSHIPPTSVVKISENIVKYAENKKLIIMGDNAGEYMISQNSYKSFLNMINHINDKIMNSNSTFLLEIDENVLDKKELAFLKRTLHPINF